MARCFLMDIDGTVADLSHRRPWVASKPKNWKAFHAAIDQDAPIEPTIAVIRAVAQNFPILAVSGRPADHMNATLDWLQKHEVPFTDIFMRPAGDFRPDDIIKSELLDLILEQGWQPMGVFDDRQRVCRMWIERGIFVFDVSQGRGEF